MTNTEPLDLDVTFGDEHFHAHGYRADVLKLYAEWLEMARHRGAAPRMDTSVAHSRVDELAQQAKAHMARNAQ